jgi:alpha-D-xyloside xylohydrolase
MNELRIPIKDGTCVLRPIHDRAIRVQIIPHRAAETWESAAVVRPGMPECTRSTHQIRTAGMSATFDPAGESLSFHDAAGRLLLEEVPGSRRLEPGTIQDVPCFLVEQGFRSPPDEHVHGLGQFQDGHANLRGVTRRLLQVNTQIAVPIILSSRGYGLFWHQAGVTDFNPADDPVELRKDAAEGPEFTLTVTGSEGAYTDTCRIREYHGVIEVARDEERVLFLDYGTMTNRHELYLDGAPVIRQENFWLPPSADVRVRLTAGRHTVRVVATKGEPVLCSRRVADVTSFRSPHAGALDYIVFAGTSADEIIAAFRDVTGHAPLLPRWAYGFWQCRERYTTQEELLENARGYRERRLPVDVMVQDWQYWPKD